MTDVYVLVNSFAGDYEPGVGGVYHSVDEAKQGFDTYWHDLGEEDYQEGLNMGEWQHFPDGSISRRVQSTGAYDYIFDYWIVKRVLADD